MEAHRVVVQYLSVLVILAVLVGVWSEECKVNKIADCEKGSKRGNVTELKYQGARCDEKGNQAILVRGTSVELQINFTSGETSNKVKAVVHGIIGGIPVPFPLDNPDACKNSSITCPIKDKTAYYYTSTLEIVKQYPVITLTVEWELRDDENKDLICVAVAAEIED